MSNSKILYMHIGCGNRGCEATAKTISNILKSDKEHFTVFSKNYDDEIHCGTDSYAKIEKMQEIVGMKPLGSIPWRLLKILKIDKNATTKYLYKKILHKIKEDDTCISTGGDLYCYGEEVRTRLRYVNHIIKEKGAKNILWACSINPDSIDEQLLKDLKEYDYIFARESITYYALKERGVKNLALFPDPAFILETEEVNDLIPFEKNEYVGINYSIHTNKGKDINTINFSNITYLIDRILEDTTLGVLLIPHVFWNEENDLDILNKIYEKYSDSNRVYLVKDKLSVSQLKYVIGRSRYYIGARTHSVIAAYSSGVPTLALGYSIKSKGIAKDIFGTYQDYVLDMKCIQNKEDVYKAFLFIQKNEMEIKQKLIDKQKEFTEDLQKQQQFCLETLKL